MTLEDAYVVLRREGFMGYMGPGYTMEDAIHDFMRQHPRGKGIKGHEQSKHDLYQACLAYKVRRSRTLAFYRNSG